LKLIFGVLDILKKLVFEPSHSLLVTYSAVLPGGVVVTAADGKSAEDLKKELETTLGSSAIVEVRPGGRVKFRFSNTLDL
jgi:hypothetical protein